MLMLKLMSVAMLAMIAAPGFAASFGQERWEKRIVVIFATPDSHQAREQSTELLAVTRDLADRDMLVVLVEGDTVKPLIGDAGSPLDPSALRKAFGVGIETPFRIILIGKDGTEKLRRDTVVPPRDIFDLVDSMPMRRSETREG